MKKMFDLWKSKFYCKCKSDVKLVRTRIDIIKKKRNAMQKYLRNDVVDLLRSGLDVNAYGRAGGLLVELKRTECYDFIEQCAVHISDNLTVLNKQKECPEECKEAVSCLIIAAARFADLPELRDLRTIFTERYGNSLDFYVNKEFVEKLKSGIPSKEEKLRLLQDIAQESDIEWDSKALENKLYNEATRKKDYATETNDRQYTLSGGEDESIQERDVLAKGPPPGLPVKDIQVDKIKKTKEVMHENELLKYNSIPPPYTIPEESKAKSSFTYGTKDGANRSSSFPGESMSPSGTPKRHTRATSFQPELLNGNNVHVHPKLPEYDDFLVRLEALRRKS